MTNIIVEVCQEGEEDLYAGAFPLYDDDELPGEMIEECTANKVMFARKGDNGQFYWTHIGDIRVKRCIIDLLLGLPLEQYYPVKITYV